MKRVCKAKYQISLLICRLTKDRPAYPYLSSLINILFFCNAHSRNP
ncbi:hypothetical protein [Anaerostipes caccae]|nr:hypothetical protein [Anaerostipes caccae]MCB7301931.1 hypothetical protein [Anaerostipes caccae]